MEGNGNTEKLEKARLAFIDELILTLKEQNRVIGELITTMRELVAVVAQR